MKRQFSACQIPHIMYLYIFNSFRVVRCLSQCVSLKIAIFTYRTPHFCFPWRRPCDYHAICCMVGKTIQCLPNPSQHVPIYLQQFPSITRKLLKVDKYLLRGVWQALNCLSIHATYCVIIAGASPVETKNEGRGT